MALERRLLVVLADGDEAVPGPVEDHVGVAPDLLRRERLELAWGHDAVQPAGREVRHDDEVAVDEVRAAAVFVDAAPGVETLGREAGRGAVRVAPDEHLAAFLFGPALEPPANAAGRADLRDRDDTGGQQGDWKRRFPGAVGREGGLGQRAVLQPRV
jgi:hypothetical protein